MIRIIPAAPRTATFLSAAPVVLKFLAAVMAEMAALLLFRRFISDCIFPADGFEEHKKQLERTEQKGADD